MDHTRELAELRQKLSQLQAANETLSSRLDSQSKVLRAVSEELSKLRARVNVCEGTLDMGYHK